ncbi:hypothetical protein EJB05_30027 [Eragrostis curvula]|uniref:Uncharacterized protein n=1 Tax=Eragrostis curvula TaxID=38414 RepID=A0A5J9UVY0_9POAL|nr:hypothetical protein EJB05_30027 [Eragrostis curvula]
MPLPTSWSGRRRCSSTCPTSVLGTIADGGSRVNDIDRLYPLLDDTAAKDNPHVAALRIFFHDARKRPPRDVASWMHGWKTAAEKLEKLALKCPELEGKLHLPSPHYAPKRWQINLSGVRPTRKAYKEKGNKPKACDISCLYEQKRQEVNKRLSVPPYRSGFSSNETSGSVISDMQIELAVPQVCASISTRSRYKWCGRNVGRVLKPWKRRGGCKQVEEAQDECNVRDRFSCMSSG